MATFTLTATERRNDLLNATSHGGANGVKVLASTVEVTAVTTVGRTISFGRIPSNARVLGASRLYWDDLATSGSPTLDLGLAEVNGNLANSDDPDALSNGHDISAAANDQLAVAAIANYALPAWDQVASESSDPGGALEVYGSLVDAAVNQAGTITLELFYYVD
jgi:hypothetical protein